eukprot:TRINITY_DN1042_c1_g1_i2.p1 TRINITY_DN1042_c1_g1~~TRINITY_DN1042_c1_g1_i2.p1  ORF type:complete len:209 (+),score=47.16 TRINITY_DN1042_c1_g1_i2:93-629(+)
MPVAWYMRDDDAAQCAESEGREAVSLEDLKALGVLHWRVDVDRYEQEGVVDGVMKERGYRCKDEIKCSPNHMDNFDDKIKIFFEEHLHDDEEIRLVMDGSGFFDVRSKADRWIRVHVKKGDLLVLPAGIYHRFITDGDNFIHAMRLFQEAPSWTPHNRSLEGTPSRDARQKYESDFSA